MTKQDKISAAQQEFKNSIVYKTCSAKFNEARELGLTGARMFNHVKEEFKIEQVKMKEIAMKYGVPPEDIWDWSI